MPKDRQRQATGFEVYTFPENHKFVNAMFRKDGKMHRLPGFNSNNRCARCYALAQRDGPMDWYHMDGRDESQPNAWVRKMPDGHSNVPHPYTGCSICKVFLCQGCFRMEGKDHKPLPDAWDHRAPTRGLLAQACAWE